MMSLNTLQGHEPAEIHILYMRIYTEKDYMHALQFVH